MSTLWRIVVMAAAIGLCAVLVVSANAEAASGANTSGTAEITFLGQATDGTHVRITEQLSDIGLSRLSPIDQAAAAPGKAFLSFYGPGGTSDNTRPAFDGISGVFISGVHLVLADHAVVPAQQSGSDLGNLLLGTYVFSVPSSTKTATLEVSASSYQAAEYRNETAAGGEITMIAFEPAKTMLVVPAPVHTSPTSGTTTTTTAKTSPSTARHTALHKATGSGVGFVVPLAFGAGTGGGAVLLVLLIPIWRRRAYRRADAEGRVIIDSPPILLSPRMAKELPKGEPRGEQARIDGEFDEPRTTGSVKVKVLGPIDFEGLVRDIETSPVREVLVFLALHPGRSFTSTDLRSQIWVEGRIEPNAATFRNYLSELRSSLPVETLVRVGYRYSLTGAIATDWGSFSALIEDDRIAERLSEALALIRGTPFEGASSGRNSPYAWCTELTHQIEATVERVAHELSTLATESGDPVFADAGVTQALKCVPASFLVRENHIRLGFAVGGQRELERRMAAAWVVLGDDIAVLEPVATGLGWVRS